MFSGQVYYPIATIDTRNELRLVEYNRGVEKVNKNASELKASFSVRNLRGPIDFLNLEDEIISKSRELFQCNISCSISNEYTNGESKIDFTYTGCTPHQFIQSLFKIPALNQLSFNGSDDWIPLDTQSVINMYPDYDQQSIVHTSKEVSRRNIATTTRNESTYNSVGRGSEFDWRFAHLEEAFNSFSSGQQAHFNIRKEGVIVVSVVRDWLVSQKLHEFMHSLFALTHLLGSRKDAETKLLFWYLAQFKSIFDGVRWAKALYEGITKYKEHFKEVYSSNEAQMKAHLEALEFHLEVTLDPTLEPDTQTMKDRIIELAELLKLCTKTMMEFTVGLKTTINLLSESKDLAHNNLVRSAFMAAVGVGVALYTRPTRLASRAASVASIAGSCSLAYYFHTLEKNLILLKKEQESALDLSTQIATSLRHNVTKWSVTTTLNDIQSDQLVQLSRVHLLSLKEDLKEIQGSLDTLSSPTPHQTETKLLGWW